MRQDRLIWYHAPMHTFFHGWRRKAGVASLVMACGLAAGWFRSVVSPTTIIMAPVNVGRLRSQDIFEISQFGYRFERYVFTLHSGDYGQGVASLSDVHFYRGICENKLCDWRWRVSGIDLGEYKVQRDLWFQRRFCVVAHQFIVLPLTLLSAYLILWKPRKATAIRPAQS
jgi:hypothetical protein